MKKQEQQYAVPTPYFAKNIDIGIDLNQPMPSRVPETQEEANALADQLRKLIAGFTGLNPHERAQAERFPQVVGDLLWRWCKLASHDEYQVERERERPRQQG
jgi:hypothetical protein